MATIGMFVNPAAIQKGDSIATRHRIETNYDPETDEFIDFPVVTRSRKINKVEICPGKPEMIHLDGECYDTRFATVIRA